MRVPSALTVLFILIPLSAYAQTTQPASQPSELYPALRKQLAAAREQVARLERQLADARQDMDDLRRQASAAHEQLEQLQRSMRQTLGDSVMDSAAKGLICVGMPESMIREIYSYHLFKIIKVGENEDALNYKIIKYPEPINNPSLPTGEISTIGYFTISRTTQKVVSLTGCLIEGKPVTGAAR